VVSSWNDIPNSIRETRPKVKISKKIQTAESTQMSRPAEHQFEQKMEPSTSRTKMFPERPYLGGAPT
jgi:hypothetical protein